MGGRGRDRDLGAVERIPVRVGVVGQHVDHHRRADGRGGAVVVGHWRRVRRGDRHAHGCYVAGSAAVVVDRVGEAVGSGHAGLIGHRASQRTDARGAGGRLRQQRDRSGNEAAIGVVVVGQDGDGDRRVGGGRGGVVDRYRQLVAAFGDHGDGGDIGERSGGVADRIGEAVHPGEAWRRRVADGAAGGRGIAVRGAPHDGDRIRVEHAGAVVVVGEDVDPYCGVFGRGRAVVRRRRAGRGILDQHRHGAVVRRAVGRRVVVGHHDVGMAVAVPVRDREPARARARPAVRGEDGGRHVLARLEGACRVAQIDRDVAGLAVDDDDVAEAVAVEVGNGDRDRMRLDARVRAGGQGRAERDEAAVGLPQAHAHQVVGRVVEVVGAEPGEVRNAVAVEVADRLAAGCGRPGGEGSAAGAEIDPTGHGEVEVAVAVEVRRGGVVGLLGHEHAAGGEAPVALAGEEPGVAVERVGVRARDRHHQVAHAVLVEVARGHRAGAAPRFQAGQLQGEASGGRAEEYRDPRAGARAQADGNGLARSVEAFRGHQVGNAVVVEIGGVDVGEGFAGQKTLHLGEPSVAVAIKEADAVDVGKRLGRVEVGGGHQVGIAVAVEIADGDAVAHPARCQVDRSGGLERDRRVRREGEAGEGGHRQLDDADRRFPPAGRTDEGSGW